MVGISLSPFELMIINPFLPQGRGLSVSFLSVHLWGLFCLFCGASCLLLYVSATYWCVGSFVCCVIFFDFARPLVCMRVLGLVLIIIPVRLPCRCRCCCHVVLFCRRPRSCLASFQQSCLWSSNNVLSLPSSLFLLWICARMLVPAHARVAMQPLPNLLVIQPLLV